MITCAISGRIAAYLPKGSMRTDWFWGVLAGVTFNGGGMLLAFGSGVLVARLLGPEGLGKYAFVLALVGVATVPSMLGMQTVIVRFLPVYNRDSAWPLARGMLRRANQFASLTGSLFGIGLVLAGLFAWGGERLWLCVLAAPLVVILAWTNLRQKTLQGLHHPVAAQLPEQLVKHSAFLTFGGILWLSGSDYAETPHGVMAVWLAASLIAFLVGIMLLRRFASPAMHMTQPQYQTRRWMATALPLLLTDSIGLLYGYADIVLLGLLATDTDVGLYHVAMRTAALMAIFLTASNWVLAPWFARLHDGGEKERLQKIITQSVRAVFCLCLVVFGLFAVWGRDILELAFGQEFGSAYSALLVLGTGRLINVAAGPVTNLLAMTGGQKVLAWTVGISAVLNVVGCVLFIPNYGIMGAAGSTAFIGGATNIGLALMVRRHLGISSSIIG